jgi:outer membrane receptor protein involved in Fe transport
MQFKAQNTLPYLMADFQRSDGHLENAQWTAAALQAGIHQKMDDIHLLHLNTDYSLNKRGIWGSRDIYQEQWETTTTFWDIGGELENKWSDKLRTDFSGKYLLDEHENAFTYSRQGYDLAVGGKIDLNNTGIHLGGGIQNNDLEVNDGNLTHPQQDSTNLRNYRASLLNANLNIQQNFQSVTAEIGMLFQQSEEKEVKTDSRKVKEQQFSPLVSLSAGFEGRGKIYARYRPGFEINSFRNAVKSIPFSEIVDMKILNYKSRMEAGFDLQVAGGIALQLLGRYSEIENYQSIVAPADSLNANFTESGYPGWIFATLEKVKISEIFGKCEWNLESTVSILAWINWRMSDIRQAGGFSSSIIGNEVPYLPAVSAYGGMSWNFYKRHELKIWADYLSNRYDDLANQIKVKGYALVSTSLQLNFGENYSFIISGQNLFDTRYEEFRGFTAPGITGWLGLRLIM